MIYLLFELMIFHGSAPIPSHGVAQVQRASYGGIGVVTEAAHVEDDARRAAGFALGVEQQVHKQLEEAKRQAREEADWVWGWWEDGKGGGGGWMMGEMGCIDIF